MGRVSGVAYTRPRGRSVYSGATDQLSVPAPVLVSTSAAQAGNTGTLTINAPAGIVTGNLLLAFVGGSAQAAPGAPSGWTLAGSRLVGAVGGMGMYTKTATGSEPASYAFTSTAWMGGCIQQWAVPASVDVFGTNGGDTTGTTATVPSITTTVSNDDWILAVWDGNIGAVYTAPAGFVDAGHARTGNQSSIYTFYQSVPAGATGQASLTASGATSYIGFSAGLKPA